MPWQESARALHSYGVMQALRRLINRPSVSGSAEQQEVRTDASVRAHAGERAYVGVHACWCNE